MAPPGLSMASLRKHSYLIPLYVAVGVGVLLSTAFLGKSCFKLDVTWNRRKNPEPWNDAKNKEFSAERPSMANERYQGI